MRPDRIHFLPAHLSAAETVQLAHQTFARGDKDGSPNRVARVLRVMKGGRLMAGSLPALRFNEQCLALTAEIRRATLHLQLESLAVRIAALARRVRAVSDRL